MTATPNPIDRIPFLKLLGLQQHAAEPGHSHIHLPGLREELCNLLPAAHGGVVMTCRSQDLS